MLRVAWSNPTQAVHMQIVALPDRNASPLLPVNKREQVSFGSRILGHKRGSELMRVFIYYAIGRTYQIESYNLESI